MQKKAYLLIVNLFVLLLLFPHVVLAEDNTSQKSPLSVSLGAIRTDAEASAVNFFIKYTKDLPDIFKPCQGTTGCLLDLTPDIKIETGDKDSFNGIILKLAGNFIKFYETNNPAPHTVDTDRMFHAFPIAIQVETNRNFDNVSTLLETGYVPFYLRESKTHLKLGLNPKIGVFLQAGYKFKGNENTETDGAIDQSEESPNSSLLRLRFNLDANVPIMPLSDKNEYGISIIPKATGWYDIANAAFYNSVEVVVRLSIAKNKHFDFKYQHGSGEPNFNKGDQFGTYITMQF